jgi:hypothetical protein
MKNCIALLIVAFISGQAMAVVNGGFDGMSGTWTDNAGDPMANITGGWVAAADTMSSFNNNAILADYAIGSNLSQNKWIGQVWQEDKATTGTNAVSFDIVQQYAYTGDGSLACSLCINIWGNDSATGSIYLAPSTGGTASAEWTPIATLTFDVFGVAAGTTLSQDVDFGTGYNYLAIAIGGQADIAGWKHMSVGIDNVVAGADIVPEPASLLLLGLGALSLRARKR